MSRAAVRIGRGLCRAWVLFAPPLLVLAGIALALYLLGFAPGQLAGEKRYEFTTVREAERTLGLRILLPAYFPDYIRWPPAHISGGNRPRQSVALAFLAQDGSGEVLWLQERSRPSTPLTAPTPEGGKLLESQPVTVGSESGWLVRWVTARGEERRQLVWRTGQVEVTLTTVLPVADLQRMAESIHP